ncbi:MAG: HEPN domain-containing protein [Planctomycetaceae bacterium]|jgi:HEPN domain-containing protein|nr:HEPN domain-containing protein [Planctomycetaceae bacterium]
MTVDELLDKWFAKARKDLHSAHLCLEPEDNELESVCFFCQQTAEKALKAYLISHNIEPIRTHDTEYLCQECMKFDPTFESHIAICRVLKKYAIEIRYPDPMIEIDESTARQTLEYAQAVYNFCYEKTHPNETKNNHAPTP